ncbi:hypothetical protein GWO43_26130, partial [candidate division KSB1 bacterium]|nr:hypothetical protein [candidate division KSB1 bacterium]NIV70239.1 hypothetical protein [Phycisphaerae bacterium]NIR71127.1 hypothetical protein [candidate division KSB1 bacterium]NIS26143.1 hypothetical protein [candidate division KSB1 bacterium]NIT74289.1 hypothetical protein [candidate division KSB1 bacterium]
MMKAFMRRYSAGILATFICLRLVTAFCQTGLASDEDNQASNRAIAAAAISIEQLASPVMAGSLMVLNVTVGSPSEPISALFGLSFELVYSNDAYLEFIEPVQAAAGPFLQPDTYTFTRHEPENNILYLAVSRKRGAPGQDGFGIVMTMPVRIKDTAPPGWQTCFAIRNSSANDPLGTSIPLVNGAPVCIVVDDGLAVIPNPFTP